MAFEMGPPFQMLDINKRYLPNIIACCHYFHQCITELGLFITCQFPRLNPDLDLDIYKLAIYDRNGTVFYEVIIPIKSKLRFLFMPPSFRHQMCMFRVLSEYLVDVTFLCCIHA